MPRGVLHEGYRVQHPLCMGKHLSFGVVSVWRKYFSVVFYEIKGENMNKKKIILTGILSTTLSIGLGVTPIPTASLSVAEAHFMSSAEEHSIGRAAA